MTGKRWLSVLMLFLCCFTGMFAQKETDQKAEDAAKEKLRRQTILIDSLIADARELRLPENRAFVLSRVGNRIWDIDSKRASDLFHDAVNELLSAQAAAESARRTGQQNELLNGQSTRPQLLQTIAAHDAEFALQSLYKTRPAAIERALANRTSKADAKIRSNGGNDQYLAQAEINLEQTLMRQAAEQSPERAIALLKAALKNGISNETLPLLKKLFEKDPAAANELAGDVIGQISRKSFTIANNPDYQSIQIAISLLNEFIRAHPASEKVIKFDDSQMHSLAEKLVGYYLDRGSQYGYGFGPSLVAIAEKLMPASVERLKETEKTVARRGYGGIYQDEGSAKLMNSETPVEQMLSEGAKLPPELRSQVMQNAANRLMAAGNVNAARSVIDGNFSDEALESALANFNSNYSSQLISQGKFSEAEALIDQFSDANRIGGLINLANAVFNNDNAKNRSYAAAILEKARGQLPPQPENNNDMSQMMQVIAAYSKIEPSEGFRMFDGLIQQINDITEAAAVVNAFQGGYNIRQGEMIIAQGTSSGVYIDPSVFRNFAETDFDRTLNTISAFSRREIRITLKQQLLEGM